MCTPIHVNMHMSKIFHAMFHNDLECCTVIFITDIFFDKISPEDTDTGDISLILMTLRQTWMTQLIQARLQNFVP